MQALQNCALLSSATHAMDQLHDLLRQRREAHIRQTRQRGVVQADGASEPECPGVTATGRGNFAPLVRADCPFHSAPLHQRDDRGLQQQDQADPADGIWSTQCTQEAKAHFSLVWSALALGLNDGEEPFPLVLASLPALGLAWLDSEWVDWTMVLLAAGIALSAHRGGFTMHRRCLPASVAVV